MGGTVAIAFLDVGYKGTGARAACVLADSWESESPNSTYVQDIDAVEPYEPGKFFLRELPCILSVLRLLPSRRMQWWLMAMSGCRRRGGRGWELTCMRRWVGLRP